MAKLHRDKKGFLILLPKFRNAKKANICLMKIEDDKIILGLVNRKFRKAKFANVNK